jgi:hypothetical protein
MEGKSKRNKQMLGYSQDIFGEMEGIEGCNREKEGKWKRARHYIDPFWELELSSWKTIF